MKKLMISVFLLVLTATAVYIYLNFRSVKVIDARQNTTHAEILVDRLPISTSASIDWWMKNKSAIYSKYKILPSDAGGQDT